MKFLIIIFALVLLFLPKEVESSGRNVILIHGWNGNTASWDTAKAAYQANGDTVYVLSMPKNSFWMRSGDAVVNAKYVQSYIQNNHLNNVVLDGHSLGAMESLYIALVLKEPSVNSVVMRDTTFVSGFSCWMIPDLCSNSAFAMAIKTASVNPVPIIHFSDQTAILPQVDCTRQFYLDHNAFQTNSQVIAEAIAWPVVNPC